MELRNRIREFRTQRGLSQEHLAQAVGVSRWTIIDLEKGKYIPSVLMAIQLVKFFELARVEDLFEIIEEE